MKILLKIISIYFLLLILFNFNISFGCANCCNGTLDAGKTTCTPCLTNPLGEGKTNINIIIGQVINAVLGVVGSLALLMFIYGGFTWMLAAGNNERVQKGKNILVWATVGLVVIFSAYAIVLFVFQGLGVT